MDGQGKVSSEKERRIFIFCQQCGRELMDQTNFCSACEARQNLALAAPTPVNKGHKNLIGFSDKINDPAFAKYLRNTNRWSVIFAGIIAAAIIGFTVAGALGVEGMENPQSFFIGLVIGGMFMLIALFTVIDRKRSKTWDGKVTDKTIQKKRRKQRRGNVTQCDHLL